MDEHVRHQWLRDETRITTYPLPDGAYPSVEVGDRVQMGDVLAEVPSPPHFLALADTLRLSDDASRNTIATLDGTSRESGAPIHRQRSGLRTRTLHAPFTGTLHGLPAYGTVLMHARDGGKPVCAARPGLVTAVTPEAMSVASRIVRCPFAFAIGPPSVYGLLESTAAYPNEAARTLSGATERTKIARVVAHIESVTKLTSLLRRAGGPLIVGAVSDAVAWELLTRDTPTSAQTDQALIVLCGPGTPGQGAAAIQRLHTFGGATIEAHRRTCQLTIFPNTLADEIAETLSDTHTDTVIYTDPAQWNIPCTLDDAARLALLDANVRALVVRTSAGDHRNERTPLTNIAIRPESR